MFVAWTSMMTSKVFHFGYNIKVDSVKLVYGLDK